MPPRSAVPYICSACRKQAFAFRRAYPIRSLATVANPPFPPAEAYAALSSRRLILLDGQDASKYLQGLITRNIAPESQRPQQGFYSAFLNAQGRVLHDVFIYPTTGSAHWRGSGQGRVAEGAYLLEVDANEADALFKHLKRYRLRAKVGLRVLDDGELRPWAVWGSGAPESEDLTLSDNRVPDGVLGYRSLLPGDLKPELDAEQVPPESHSLLRMINGVPEGQTEIVKEHALPQESNIDYMGGIDFRKGCYVGQELTIRTHHTGVVRKRILPVHVYSSGGDVPNELSYQQDAGLSFPPSGSNISRLDKKGRSAGKFLGGLGNIGLALCRLEQMTDTALTGESSQWNPEAEFKIAWDDSEGADPQEVKVKAFIPWWHGVRGQEQKVQRPSD